MPKKTKPSEPISFFMPIRLARSTKELPPGIARIYGVSIMEAGETKNGIFLPDVVLSTGAAKFEGTGSMFDHPGFLEDPLARNLVAMHRDSHWDAAERRIDSELHMLAISAARPAIELLDIVVEMQEAGVTPPNVGISALVYLTTEWQDNRRVATSIREVVSADIVYRPAAGGGIHKILQSVQGESTMNRCPHCNQEIEDGKEHTCPQGNAQQPPTPPERNTQQPPPVGGTASAPPAPPASPQNPASAQGQPDALSLALQREQCATLLNLRLQNSGLPQQFAAIVRQRFTTGDGVVRVFTPEELDREIEAVKTAAASFSQGGAIQGMGSPTHDGRPAVQGMWNTQERLTAAYERLMGLPVATQFADVPRLRGLAELYVGLTGDTDMRGVYRQEHVRFAIGGAASPNTAAVMAELTANVMNKIMMAQWNRLARAGYEWWRRAVAIRQFPTLQPTAWIVAGGFGDLPTVTDGGVYTELVWNDKRENISFLKKGGFASLTLEMIDKDDVAGWRAVPEALGTSAIRTISAACASVFTSNPTLNEDSAAMFSEARGNLIAYDLDAPGWEQATNAMYTATEFNSSKRLAVQPDRVLVPIQKRRKGFALFNSDKEPGGSLNDRNVAMEDGTQEGPVLVVPDFTDTDDWVALANPDLAPCVGAGFRFGEQPEIWSVADPNSFLMFYQDALPIKVRWFYAVGAIDYRSAVLSQL